jgi:hypothetical protein
MPARGPDPAASAGARQNHAAAQRQRRAAAGGELDRGALPGGRRHVGLTTNTPPSLTS